MPVSFARLYGFFLAVLLSLTGAGAALAYNVPGSAQSGVKQGTEIATGMIVNSVKENMRPMRDQTGSVQVSTSGDAATGLSATTGGTTPLTFGLTYRDVDTTELKGHLAVGRLLLGHNTPDGLLYFGGLITETGNLRTPLDNGRIKHTGAGLVLGLDYRISDQLFLTGIIGAMKLDYDVSRGGGSVTGSFDADRQFVDLSADYLTQSAYGDLRLSFGLLYVQQENDAYTESGGAAVTAYRFDQLSANFDARNTWGQAGDLRPYLEVGAQGRLGGSSGATGLVAQTDSDWEARIGIGAERAFGMSLFDVGLGANFDDDAFSGLDAKLKYTLRF